ncbi:MAG: gamma carbonic anhydrase family protein [Chitinophagales bacterium]|jgi:carbonic anhydrase/acetyltransferase-like protein (isoleucine patch superfamily)|nr:gamma carbonic anhydrase family protein [Chitinophagales bacterium]
MSHIITVQGKTPQIAKNVWIAPNATITGEVEIGEFCSVWFNAVIRGDVHYIKIGQKTNIQDNATIHCTYKKSPTNIGNLVSIGHNAIVHGCTIYDNVLIGMGAVIMDDVVIEPNCIIGAGSVVTQKTIIKEGSVYAGNPAKFIKNLDIELQQETLARISNNYIMYSQWYQQ